MCHSTIADIDAIARADLDRLAETPTLDDMRQMDSEAKLRLLAYCVASQITSLSFHSDRDRQLAQIVGAAQINMADKRSEEHTSELQSLMRISYAVFCLKKKQQQKNIRYHHKQYNN